MKPHGQDMYEAGHLQAVMQCTSAARRAGASAEVIKAIMDEADKCPVLDASDKAAA